MIFNLSTSERSRLRELQKHHRNKKTYIRATVLLMLDGGFDKDQISYALGIDESTVRRYKEKYKQSKNLDDYLSDQYKAYCGKLKKSEKAILVEELDTYLYRSAKEVVAFIKQRFNKTYTPSGVIPLLHQLGFVYKKTRVEPSKADAGKQAVFLEKMQDHLDNLSEDEAAFFLDGVHPQHNTKSERGWIKKGEEFPIAANSGRKRVNINGALNPFDLTNVVIDKTDSVNTQSTIRLLEKIRLQNQSLSRILLFSDNARYYKSKMLKEYLQQHPVFKMIHLPSYSPNLNLIERLWKFLRKKVINSFYYEKFEEFEQTILDFFKNLNQYEDELKSLLTLNFPIMGN